MSGGRRLLGLLGMLAIAFGAQTAAHASSLVVDIVAPGLVTHDLTALGTTDWKHFGRNAVTTVNRKAGVPDVIGDYTKIGPTSVLRFNASVNERQSVSWSDGTPQATETGTGSGLFFRGVGEGYELTLPADGNVRTARVYLGGWKARGRLEVSLSDGSAAPFQTTFENAEGIFDRAVTITYSAGAAGQTLRLRFIVEDNFGVSYGNLTLSAVALAGEPLDLPFDDNFDAGDDSNWSTDVDDTNSATDWFVSDGAMRQSVRVAYGSSFEESYHVGTYRYLIRGDTLEDYRVRVRITPEDDTVIDDIGLMFRYRGPDDYYRISQSARHGYTRLEKRQNGVFSTLGVNAIGYEPGQTTTYEVEVVGSELWVRIDGELVFAVADAAHASGSIALYTQDAVRFDEVSVTAPSTAPQVALRSPGPQAVIPGTTLRVEAATLNPPAGSEVVIEVDGFAPRRLTAPPYVVTLNSVPSAEYGITARLLDEPGGTELATTAIRAVAVGGAYTLAVGDSNTNGFGDRYAADNRLVSRILGTQGYAGTLADRLDMMSPFFNVVYNEGISGDTADRTRFVRLGSLLERHSLARRALVSLGTNDISAGRDSGESCGAGDEVCLADTIRGDIQAIVDELDDAGLEVWTATVPPAWPRGTPSPTSARMLATQEANRAIRNGITGDQDGPDLFSFFYTDIDGDSVPDVARLSLYNDRFHFNGLGHHIVALLWYNALIGDATGTSIAPFYLSEPSVSGYQQNLLDPGDDLRVDDFETLTSFPAELAKGIWVMAARRSKRPMAAIGYSPGPTQPARRSYSAATRRTARTPA